LVADLVEVVSGGNVESIINVVGNMPQTANKREREHQYINHFHPPWHFPWAD